jgi:hypothetical protein
VRAPLTLAVARETFAVMRVAVLTTHLACLAVTGCSGAEASNAETNASAEAEPTPTRTPTIEGDRTDGIAGATGTVPATAEQTSVEALSPAIVVFNDPDTDFGTADVYDATREIVRFDAERGSMVSAATGDSVSGWMTNGNDLGPFGSFRVRFGSEGGQRRAYFTETGNGTICDLVLSGAEMLDIYATSERPPIE